MNDDLIARIRNCPSLPSLPAVAFQILEMTSKPEVDIAEIARAISKDPALSTRILRTVNSSFYGRGQNIATISHALVILGLHSVKTLVLGFSLATNLSKDKTKGFNHVGYWRRSIYAASAARTLATRLKVVQQEEAFLAALLQDIGMLVFNQVVAEQYGPICEKAKTHTELITAEKEALDATHAEAGAVLVQLWKFPPILAEPISASHEPGRVTDPNLQKLTKLVQLAGWCADVFVDEPAAAAISQVRSCCSTDYQMNEADCDQLLQEIAQKTKEVAPLFEINIGATSDYETILKKANEALVELTLQTQMQATQLQQQNQTLKKQAVTDALTGLSNRAAFDEFLVQQFARSGQNSEPLTLLMLDVDKFKSINDKYGHQAGDQVLAQMGSLLRSAIRPQDLAARYGGEELALIMPGTPRTLGAAIAETIRRAVAAEPLSYGSHRIAVTVSIGVATVEPGSPLRDPSLLLKAADMAVYAAKHQGRNCVKIFSAKSAA